jgi:hypothetical protein
MRTTNPPGIQVGITRPLEDFPLPEKRADIDPDERFAAGWTSTIEPTRKTFVVQPGSHLEFGASVRDLSTGNGKNGYGGKMGRIAQNPCAIGIGGFPHGWEVVGSPER